MSMSMSADPLCQQFCSILGTPPQVINGICTAMTVRKFDVTIMGRPSRSAVTVPMMFTFESMDKQA